jgi:hypothetical protein
MVELWSIYRYMIWSVDRSCFDNLVVDADVMCHSLVNIFYGTKLLSGRSNAKSTVDLRNEGLEQQNQETIDVHTRVHYPSLSLVYLVLRVIRLFWREAIKLPVSIISMCWQLL